FHGQHNIGFRIVEGELPKTAPIDPEPPLSQLFVKQSVQEAARGPDPSQPWFRQQDILPIPPCNSLRDALAASALPPDVQRTIASPGATVCSNGDGLATYNNAPAPEGEDLTNVRIVALRRRHGSRHWDFPSVFFDFADCKTIAPTLWSEGSRIYFFCGGGLS